MIPIQMAPEPEDFEAEVRQPGRAFLASIPAGGKVDFRGREYWRRAGADLYRAYSAICAYTCHHVAADTGWRTVEHFRPKKVEPALAYEWFNFRFVCGRLNGAKGEHMDVADPFDIPIHMFTIDFPDLRVKPGLDAIGEKLELARSTIRRLKLNDEICFFARFEYVFNYAKGHMSLDLLRYYAPFLARELERRNLEDRNVLSALMGF